MKKILLSIFIMTLFSCSNKSYYKYIVKSSTQDEIGQHISYFISFKLANDSLNSEFLMLFETINATFLSINKSTNSLQRQLEKDKLDLKVEDFNFDIDDYLINSSVFIDSLNLLTTEEILNKYFEKGIRLKTNEISLQKVKEIVYVITKRKQYIYAYFSGGLTTKYKLNIFFGKLKYYNSAKMYKPIEEFIIPIDFNTNDL